MGLIGLGRNAIVLCQNSEINNYQKSIHKGKKSPTTINARDNIKDIPAFLDILGDTREDGYGHVICNNLIYS